MIKCQAQVYVRALDRSWVLEEYEAVTPRAALRWLRSQAGQAADQLDPPTDTIPSSLHQWRTAQALRHWRDDMATNEEAIGALAEGLPVSLTGTEHAILITLTAVPQMIRIPPWAPRVHSAPEDVS
ncbi:hypothetical protein GTW37_34780 [Streptomyces sp. SID4931]|nr:hypothetical protein [Streptomyces sp. SID4931]SCG08278.1 hypothetical protein GA0115255_123727 [Streptomyces sp. Ncost-T6T-2b]